MSFASRLTRLPRPFDEDKAADTAAHALWAEGDTASLLRGAGGTSPHLHALIGKEADWLEEALDDPDAALPALFAELREGAPDTRDDDLRRAKRRVALLTGLCDVGGVWSLEQVTGALTDFADLAVHAGHARPRSGARSGAASCPGATEDDIAETGGMVALAMGKMGAGELNYSSDIDLICLFDEDALRRATTSTRRDRPSSARPGGCARRSAISPARATSSAPTCGCAPIRR